jgi:hypothetical protein
VVSLCPVFFTVIFVQVDLGQNVTNRYGVESNFLVSQVNIFGMKIDLDD